MLTGRLSKNVIIIVFSAAALVACGGRNHVQVPEQESRTVQRLRSDDPSEVKAGLADAEQMSQLSPEIVELLISELGNPKYGHLLVNDTLVTSETPVTRVLSRHAESGEPLRRALVAGRSPQVRRFSAYVLGEMRYAPAILDLRAVIRAAITTTVLDEQRGTERDPRALLTAAVDAHAKIDSRSLVEFLLPFSTDPHMKTRRFACESLWRVVRADKGPGLFTVDEMQSGECGRRWNDWWARAKGSYDNEIFRWATPAQTTESSRRYPTRMSHASP